MMRSRAESAGMPRRDPSGVARLAMPLLGAALCLSTASCAADRYAGIDLRPGAAPAEVQELALRAQSGDKQAQLGLGERYELGDGVLQDRDRARRLYMAAATDSGGTRMIFLPHRNGVSAVPLNAGAAAPGLNKAREKASKARRTQYAVVAANSSHALPVYVVRWYAGGSSDWRGKIRCSIGDAAKAPRCRRVVRPNIEIDIKEYIYPNAPVSSLDGYIFCNVVICEVQGGRSIVFEQSAKSCLRPLIGVIFYLSKIVFTLPSCSIDSPYKGHIGYINREWLEKHPSFAEDVKNIIEGERS